MLRNEIKKFPEEIQKTISKNMNLFFILMLVIMGTRTVYYILVGLNFEYKPDTKGKPDNYYLLVIYFQECVFNFVTFYNLVLKQNTN